MIKDPAEAAMLRSIDPSSGEEIATYATMAAAEVDELLERVQRAYPAWRGYGYGRRAEILRRTAALLREQLPIHAAAITAEMGKPITEAEAEIEKSAWVCQYYAEHAERFLADTPAPSDSPASFVAFAPLGAVLAVMPWNYPYWQVFRFLAPALMAGNVAVLKHAANVTGCALRIERLLAEAGLPDDAFRILRISSDQVGRVIAHPTVRAVTLTGSEPAGRAVAAAAGASIKKTVLELGGSDPFIVLADADIPAAASTAIRSRFGNCGQSCIAAKRVIVVDSIAEEFEAEAVAAAGRLVVGDPRQWETELGPLARADLRADLEDQLHRSVTHGVRVIAGGNRPDRPGWFFEPTVAVAPSSDVPILREETFGPLMAVIHASSTEAALTLANDSRFGLGGSLWTADVQRGTELARQMDTGGVFINGMTHSDPRLPFGGVKASGYGRELSDFGIREFTNAQTIWLPAAS